jgi:ABC-2 type transport system ATP-binding protein
VIHIEHLSKSFGAKKVLENLSISFGAGRAYGIVGENGAGKTTFFRCIGGLESHTGRVTCAAGKLKDRLGFLPTEPFFFARMTGREYLQLLCNARGLGQQDFNEKNVFDLPLDQYAVHYSTGMKKKLALMGILLQQNDFFILDEPFNGVDIQSNMLITEIILRLKSLGKSVVISSHILSTLSDTCDEIHLLKNGHFEKKVLKEGFAALAGEMREVNIAGKIERLGL